VLPGPYGRPGPLSFAGQAIRRRAGIRDESLAPAGSEARLPPLVMMVMVMVVVVMMIPAIAVMVMMMVVMIGELPDAGLAPQAGFVGL